MSVTTLVLVVLIILLIGGAPQVSGHPYGYGPSGIVGVLLIVLLVLMLLGRI